MPKLATTIDEDLYNGLQQARKKKPRYFAMIAKGPEVVGLIVQKKIINDSLAQKAKSENKGNLIIQGVCHGEGVDLKFEVLGAEPSIQPKKIKEFIGEQTELVLKPQWAAVTKLSVVVDEESQAAAAAATPAPGAGDPLAAFQAWAREVASALAQLKDSNPFRAGLQQRLNTEAALVGSTPANIPGGLKTLVTLEQEVKAAESFATRATEVYFAIEKLAEQDPVRGQLMYSWNAEINSARNSSATALEYVPAALERLAALEGQVQSRQPAAAAQQATNAAPAQTPVQPAAVNGQALQDRLKSLLLRAKTLFTKDPSSRETLLPVAQATSTLVMKNSPDAAAALDKLEQMVDAAEKGQTPSAQQAAPAATASDPKHEQWIQEHARIEPLYLAFLAGNPPEATKIRAVMAYCTQQAEAGAYDKALMGLKRLEPFLGASAPATAKAPEAKMPETKTAEAAVPAGAATADELRQQLADLRMQLEKMVGDATPDQLGQVMALQEQAEPLVKQGFAHLDANKLAEAAASIEALRKLLGGQPQAEPTAQAATAEPKAEESFATSAPEEPKSAEVGTPTVDEAASTADELRKQLAELRMQLEKMLGDAAPDQLSEAMALQELAEPLVKECFAHLDGGKLAEAATSIAGLQKLLGGEPQAAPATEPSALSADTAADAKPDASSQPAEAEVSKADFPRLWQDAQENWRDAVDTVNEQLEKLRVALLGEADPELAPLKEQLKQIGEVGLGAITANQRTRLQAALMDVNQAAGPSQAKALAKTQELVAAFRKHIESDGRVAACDDNPWDVKVSIRGTFGPALQELSKALAAGLKA